MPHPSPDTSAQRTADSNSPPARPRIRDLEEMDRRNKQAAQSHELRMRIAQTLLLLICIAAVAVVISGWAELRRPLQQADAELEHLRSLSSLEVEMCRRYTGDDPAAAGALTRLAEAEHQLGSQDLPSRVRGYREYRRLARVVRSRASLLARNQRYNLAEEFTAHIQETEGELKRGNRLFNQRSKEYNLATQRFPGSVTRSMLQFPKKLPYLTD